MYNNTLFEEFTDEELAGFRLCLAEEYREIDQESLEIMLDNTLANMNLEDAESFLKTLNKVGNAAKKVATSPLVSQIGQAALPAVGAAIGTAVAPGVGTAIGGALGNVAGQTLAGVSRQVNTPQATTVNTSQPNVVQNTSVPANSLRRTQTSVSAAANQILQLVQSPQFLQALASLSMGAQGRKSINVRSQENISNVPTGAFLNLLESLANQAAMEATKNESAIPSYLEDVNGEALCDLANPDERARVLMEHLQEDETFYSETDFDDDEDDEGDDEVFDWLEEAGLVEERFF
jgi:hypothetical protein